MKFLFPEYVRKKRNHWLVFFGVWLSLVCLGSYRIYYDYELTLSQEKSRLMHHVRLIDTNLTQELRSINAALESVRLDISAFEQHPDGANRASRRLRTLNDAMPGVVDMLITNQAGRIVAASTPETIGLNVNDSLFSNLAQNQAAANALYVAEPFVPTGSAYAMSLVKTWADEKHEFAGIVLARLDQSYFEILLSSVLYAEDMRSSLIYGDGKVFMTSPANLPFEQSNLSGLGSVFRAHLDTGLVASVHSIEVSALGDARLVAYRTVHPDALHMNRPLMLAVSRSLQAVLAPWRLASSLAVLAFALLSVAGASGMWLLQRKQSELNKIADALAHDALEHTQWLDIALAAGDLGLIDLNFSTGLRKVNARAQEMVGNDPNESPDTYLTWLERIHPEDRFMVSALDQKLTWSQSDTMSIEYRIQHAAGHWVWIHWRGTLTERSADGMPLRMIGIYQDITARKAEEAQLTDFAFLDMLTQLPNRRLLMDRLAQAQAASARSRKPVALLFMDLDHFKPVNDTLGHAIGDLLLQQVAERLQRCVRQSDTVARLGGDEFVVVLDQLGDTLDEAQANAVRMADKIQTALRQPMRLAEHTCSIASSMGITLFCGDAVPVDQLLKQADSALYQAKANGRNCAVLYSLTGVFPDTLRTALP